MRLAICETNCCPLPQNCSLRESSWSETKHPIRTRGTYDVVPDTCHTHLHTFPSTTPATDACCYSGKFWKLSRSNSHQWWRNYPHASNGIQPRKQKERWQWGEKNAFYQARDKTRVNEHTTVDSDASGHVCSSYGKMSLFTGFLFY